MGRASERRFTDGRPQIDIRGLKRAGELSPDAAGSIDLAGHGVRIITRPWRFTGTRRYFECPACRGACELLYRSGQRLACRKCLKLAYSTENMTPTQRRTHKLIRQRARLGQQATSALDPWPAKPKWQRWPTYDRALQRLAETEAEHFSQVLPVRLRRELEKMGSEP